MPDKVILITGASSGFGQIAAERLTRAGHRVFGTSRQPKPDDARPFTMVPLDVRSDESVRSCVEQVLAQAGRIDVLVNNAGYALSSLIEEATLDEARDQFETNFWGVVRMTKAVLPAMRRQPRVGLSTSDPSPASSAFPAKASTQPPSLRSKVTARPSPWKSASSTSVSR